IAFKIPVLLVVALMIGVAWGTYLMCQHYFKRDYRLRLTNWTNITQLFNRGGGNLGLIATMFVSLIIGIAIIVAYAMAIALAGMAVLVNSIALAIVLIVSVWAEIYYRKNFW